MLKIFNFNGAPRRYRMDCGCMGMLRACIAHAQVSKLTVSVIRQNTYVHALCIIIILWYMQHDKLPSFSIIILCNTLYLPRNALIFNSFVQH